MELLPVPEELGCGEGVGRGSDGDGEGKKIKDGRVLRGIKQQSGG